MSMMNHQQFGRGAVRLQARDNVPLDLGEIAKWCPSVTAVCKHASRSDSYTYIPTIKVLEALDKEGFAPFSVIQGGSKDVVKRGYTKHHITLRQKDAKPLKLDETFFEINLGNSHDGTSKYNLFPGLFRLVCLNGARVDEGSFEGVLVPHRGNVVDKVIEGSFRVLAEAGAVANRVETWRQIELNRDEQYAFAKAAATLRFGETSPVDAGTLLFARRPGDQGNDLWRTFNRVQENVIRGGIAFDRTRRTGQVIHMHTREVRSVDGDVKLNRGLWALAERTATLKAA